MQPRHAGLELPDRAVGWVEQALGSPVARAEPLLGGHATASDKVLLASGDTVVLRRWTTDETRDLVEFGPAREAYALALLADSDVPVPAVLAEDAGAAHCDVPALVISWLMGSPPDFEDLSRLDVAGLAEALTTIHAVIPPEDLPAFAPWCSRHPLGTPSGTEVPEHWERLLAAVEEGLPSGPEVLLHGDFHPFNTLWCDGRLSGVIDWTYASRGHPLVDVARMAGLVSMFAPEVAQRFVDAYADRTGHRLSAIWEARELLDLLPEDPREPLDLRAFDARVADVSTRLR
jgi:aminoglycoside phosphotransferase (APT) family kinase protein